jgi:hypothetical protein
VIEARAETHAMRPHRLLAPIAAICLLLLAPASAAEPVAEIFGKTITESDLAAPGGRDQANSARARGERLRALVWRAVFADFARTHNIEPTEAEIVSNIESHRRLKAQGDTDRVAQREALLAELKSPGLSEQRRKQAQQHLDTLDKLANCAIRKSASCGSDPSGASPRNGRGNGS